MRGVFISLFSLLRSGLLRAQSTVMFGIKQNKEISGGRSEGGRGAMLRGGAGLTLRGAVCQLIKRHAETGVFHTWVGLFELQCSRGAITHLNLSPGWKK